MMTLALCAALAQDASWVETRFHRVHLRNGNFIDGFLLRESPSLVVLEVKPAGEFGVRRDMIQRVEFIKMRSIREEPPLVAIAPVAVEPGPPAVVPGPGPERVERGQTRFSLEVRKSVDTLLNSFATLNPERQGSLGASLRHLGPDAAAYACWVVRHGRTAVERPLLVEALGECEGPEVLRALTEMAAVAPDTEVRIAAIRTLAKRDGPEAAAAVQSALLDRAAKVGEAAAEEVANLYKQGRVDLDALVARMNESGEKEFIARALGKIGVDAGFEALERLLREGGPKDKVSALKAMALRSRPEEAPLAIGVLDHEEMEVRREACYYLGRAKQRVGVRALINALGDDDVNVSEAAHWSLRRLTGQTFPVDPGIWLTWWDRTGRDTYPEPASLKE